MILQMVLKRIVWMRMKFLSQTRSTTPDTVYLTTMAMIQKTRPIAKMSALSASKRSETVSCKNGAKGHISTAVMATLATTMTTTSTPRDTRQRKAMGRLLCKTVPLDLNMVTVEDPLMALLDTFRSILMTLEEALTLVTMKQRATGTTTTIMTSTAIVKAMI